MVHLRLALVALVSLPGCAGPDVEVVSRSSEEPSPTAPSPTTPPSEPWPCSQRADVDGDGRVDRAELGLDHARVALEGGEALPVPLPAPAVVRLCLGDVDGDSRAEVVAGVIRPTRGEQTFRQRLFVYSGDERGLRPRFLATKGSGELLHFGLQDLDDDGDDEILARERSDEGEVTRVYAMDGLDLRERPELRAKAPPYRFHPDSLDRVSFEGEVERSEVLGSVPLSTSRLKATARSVAVAKGLSNIANRREFRWLSRDARQALERDGFVVIAPPRPPAEFHEVYVENQYLGLPSFVTADTALHFTHLVVDDVLTETEQHLLGPTLARLVDSMRFQADEVARRAPPGLEEPLSRIQLRLDLAATILKGGSVGLEGERASAVALELERLEARAGKAGSSLGIDYSDFVVRGHYTNSEALGRYYKAFRVLSASGASDPREAALWAALALSEEPQRRLLALIDGFGRALAGPPANRTPLDLLAEARRTFGSIPELGRLDSREPWHGARGGQADDVTLLARRWPADNSILLEAPATSGLPDPLVIFASLGSARALEHLSEGSGLVASIDESLEALGRGERGDPHSVGGRWLLSLRWLVLPFEEGYPEFQRTAAWADHGLVTAAASWAELRRDTTLYVQPPIVWAEGGDEGSLPPGDAAYVEPVPELYRDLSDVLGALERALVAAHGGGGPLSETRRVSSIALLTRSRSLLELFEAAARRELEGAALTREQHEALRSTGEVIEATLAGEGTLRLDPVPVVADVFHLRDPETGATSMLTVATGHVDVIVVAIPLGRRVVLARGPVASFYHFEAAEPLTDEAWRAVLERGEAPARPPWCRVVAGPAGSRRRGARPRERMRD